MRQPVSDLADLLGIGSGDAQKTPYGTRWFVQGVVSENNNNRHPGMVRVEFTGWQQGKNISDWVEVLRSHGGADYGAYLIPEVGETVLVGFIGGASQRPFVLGSLYPAGAEIVQKSFHKQNLVKRFRTKGGVEAAVSDEKGKQRLRLATPKALALDLSDSEETVVLTDRQGKNRLEMNCGQGKVTLQADTALTLKSGGCEITLGGKKGTISIQCDRLEINAGQMASLSGGQLLKLEGGALRLEGKQTLAAKGGAVTEISGGVVKIN